MGLIFCLHFITNIFSLYAVLNKINRIATIILFVPVRKVILNGSFDWLMKLLTNENCEAYALKIG